MRFLADQDVYASTLRFLAALGHDVIPAARMGLSRAPDGELLQKAHQAECLLVTRDSDFGRLVLVEGLGWGVIFLRVLPSTQQSVNAELETVLTLYTESQLRAAFVVVEPGRHRIRRLGASEGRRNP